MREVVFWAVATEVVEALAASVEVDVTVAMVLVTLAVGPAYSALMECSYRTCAEFEYPLPPQVPARV